MIEAFSAELHPSGDAHSPTKLSSVAPVEFDASALLSQFAFVGITEHYDVSVCLFFFTFGDEGKFKKYCQHRTHAAAVSNRAPRSADVFRSVFSPKSLSFIWRNNRKDSTIYWTVGQPSVCFVIIFSTQAKTPSRTLPKFRRPTVNLYGTSKSWRPQQTSCSSTVSSL